MVFLEWLQTPIPKQIRLLWCFWNGFRSQLGSQLGSLLVPCWFPAGFPAGLPAGFTAGSLLVLCWVPCWVPCWFSAGFPARLLKTCWVSIPKDPPPTRWPKRANFVNRQRAGEAVLEAFESGFVLTPTWKNGLICILDHLS